MTLTTFYVAVDPDGTCTEVPPTFAGIKQGLHDATFDLVILDAWPTPSSLTTRACSTVGR